MNWFNKSTDAKIQQTNDDKEKNKYKGKQETSAFDVVNLVLKSSATYHLVEGYKYVMKIGGPTNTTVVNILKYGDSGTTKGNWLLRFDKPHVKHNYAHLNIRHKYTGIRDPHLKLPIGSLEAAKTSGYICKTLNYLKGLAVAYDAYRIGMAAKEDYKDGTTHNTTKCALDVSFEWIGGWLGATVGGTVGSCALPLVGNIAGAAAGSAYGVWLGRSLGDKAFKLWRGKEKEVPFRAYLPWEYYNIGRADYECMLSYFSRLHFNSVYG